MFAESGLQYPFLPVNPLVLLLLRQIRDKLVSNNEFEIFEILQDIEVLLTFLLFH